MEEKVKQQYDRWLSQSGMPADLADELNSIAGDEDAITDRFYRELEFGTGGLRGVIGAGTNRMNVYNIRKATQGLANYLNASDLPKKVAIGYDSRIKSDVFAKETAAVLAANGIKAYIYPRLEPTPALSWAVRYYGCGAGVCVTASHNPAKYNGYKVYGADGCQITLEVAAKILAAIEAVDCFAVQPADFDAALAEGKIEYSSEKCLDDFVDAVYAQRVGDGAGTADLKLVYTPLNGSGLECVKKLLAKLGVTHVTVVPEQEKPDGNFPTCPYPNPEIREAMQKGLELCDKVHPDLLLGTDPDIMDVSRLYLRIYFGGAVFLFLYNTLNGIYNAQGDSRTPLIFLMISSLTNIVLDIVFVGVMGPGSSGAAAATVISQLIGCIGPMFYFARPGNGSLLHFVRPVFSGKALLKACTNGSSELMTNLSASLVGALYNWQLLRLGGADGVAAYGVIMYVSFFFAAIFIGYAQGCAPVVSYHYGADNTDELKNLLRISLRVIAVGGVAMLCFSELLAAPLSRFFVGYDAELLELTTLGMKLYSLSFLLCGFNIFGSAFFTALNNGIVSAVISFLRTLVFQVTAILVLPHLLGMNGIWLSVVAAEIAALFVNAFFLVKNRKKYQY